MLTNEQMGIIATSCYTKGDCRELARREAQRGQIGAFTDVAYAFLQEVQDKRRKRIEARWTHPTLPLDKRLHDRLLSIAIKEVRQRHVGTPTCSPADDEAKIVDYRPRECLWLVNVAKWYHYSNRFGDRFVNASWLCGTDDGQYFAVRVPGTILTIADALDYITPAEVTRAQEDGRWVERQGDIYLVELTRKPDNLSNLPRTHKYDAETRTFTHDQHKAVSVPESVRAVKAIPQRQLASTSWGAFGRGGD